MPGKRRKKKNSLHGWLLWFALTAAFALMGMSLAAFQGDLSIIGTINMGEVDLAYRGFDLDIVKGQDGRGTATIDAPDDDLLQATISDADPGFRVTYEYRIENNGSLPVKLDRCDIDDSNLHDRIELKDNNPPDLIPAKGYGEGSFDLHVQGKAGEGDYSINMDLHYILQNFAD